MEFFVDLTLLAIFIIGFTAFMGTITHGAASRLFSGGNRQLFKTKSMETQSGWSKVRRRDT